MSNIFVKLNQAFDQREIATGLKLESFQPRDEKNPGDYRASGLAGNAGGSLLGTIRTAISDAGLGKYAGFSSNIRLFGSNAKEAIRTMKLQGNLRLRTEDAAEEDDITEDTQNEEILLTEAQERAGIIAAAMAEDPAGTAKGVIAAANKAQATTDSPLLATGNYTQESYSDDNFRDSVGYSVVWNVVAARQANAIENVWPTVTLDPQQFSVDVAAQFQVFLRDVRHKSTGDETEFANRIMLIDTIIDAEILNENIIKCIPVVNTIPGKESTHHFVDNSVIQHKEVTVDGVTVTTAPLTFHTVHHLLGLSQDAIANLTNELGADAEIAPMPALEKLYLKVTNTDGAESVIMINTTTLALSSFTAKPEGNIREVQLAFKLNNFALDGTTVDITGAPAEALKIFRDRPEYGRHRINISTMVYGDGNLETSRFTLTPGVVGVGNVLVRQGRNNVIEEKDVAIAKEIADSIKSVELLGFDLDARRMNRNRLQRGPMTMVTGENEKYFVKVGSPFSTIFPAIESASLVDLIAPMTATRIHTDYRAITKLFEYAEILQAETVVKGRGIKKSNLRAIGRYLINPYYKHIRLSIADIMDSQRSKDKIEDAQHVVLNTLTMALLSGLRDSRYNIALEVQTGSAETKPTIAILTNPIVEGFLFRNGDPRILGALPYPVLVGSHPADLLGKYGDDEHEMFIVPTLPGTQFNPLNFGHHLWKPELVSTLQVTRDGATSREFVVQPYNDHHMICPFMIRITIVDLDEAINTKTTRAVVI